MHNLIQWNRYGSVVQRRLNLSSAGVMDQDFGVGESMVNLMRLGKKTQEEANEDAAAINNLKRVATGKLEASMSDTRLDDFSALDYRLTDSAENSMEEEVRHAELESRLRRMITDVMKPSIAKVSKLQADHNVMCSKFQDMVDGYQEVINAQKSAKEHSELIKVFETKLSDFWGFNNKLEAKIAEHHKSSHQRMEELEHACDSNKSNGASLSRRLDLAMEDIDRVNETTKSMELRVQRGLQKNKEHIDMEVKSMHLLVGDVRDLHLKLETEIWGPENVFDYSPPSLRRLDMQMKEQKALMSECLRDIASLQRLESDLGVVAQSQNGIQNQVSELLDKSAFLSDRVESCAAEAKADFRQASNLMAAFSANLVREARTSFKEELEHSHKMQREVGDFVLQMKDSLGEHEARVQMLGGQLQAMMKEVRIDLEICDNKRKKDKQATEEQMRQLQSRVVSAFDASESMLKGLEHVTGVVSMSLQSERMSVALDLQDFVERKDTPFLSFRDSSRDKVRKLKTSGSKQGGLDLDKLQSTTYQPQPISYQGASFERPQLLALREKLVHIAQEALQQGPVTRKPGPQFTPDMPLAHLSGVTPPLETRSPTPSAVGVPRPGSRGQPGARGSPLLEGRLEGPATSARQGETPELCLDTKQTEAKEEVPSNNVTSAAIDSVTDESVQLPALTMAAASKQKARASFFKKAADAPLVSSAPHTAR